MNVESIPINVHEIRQRNNGNNNNSPASNAQPQSAENASSGTMPADNLAQPPPGQTAASGQAGRQWTNFNNPDMEFFMEVTPASITIDSVETAHFGGNQPSDSKESLINQNLFVLISF